MPREGEPTRNAILPEAVRLDVDGDGAATITLDCPEASVNVLSTPVMSALERALDRVSADPRIRGLVIRSGKPGVFIAGADLAEIRALGGAMDSARKAALGQAILNKIEDLAVPTAAAIGGACLGGGLELALACRFRIASDSDRVSLGLPEVMLGFLPGFGGTFRLPRVVGLRKALDLILTGRTLDARSALRAGLVTRIVPEGALDAVARDIVLGRGKAGKRPKAPFAGRLLDKTWPGHALVARGALKQVMARTKGRYPAPLRALEVVRKNLLSRRERALRREAEAFGELAAGETSKALVDLFFMTERAKKEFDKSGGGVSLDRDALVGVIGAGVMGAGIAGLAARKGYRVRLRDVTPELVGRGMKLIASDFAKRAKRKSMTTEAAERALDRIAPTSEPIGYATAAFAIEAVVENVDVKRKVLAEFETEAGPDAVFATNTSSLSLAAIAEKAARKERVVGLHFFNPVDKMPLVEVVLGENTSPAAAAIAAQFGKRLGKVPLRVKDSPGFLVNRCLMPYLNEAIVLLGEGLSIEAIDAPAEAFGLPMGPLRLMDEVGLDVCEKAAAVMAAAFPGRVETVPAMARLVAAGRLGKKTGRGFYSHAGDVATPDPESVTLLALPARPVRATSPEEVADRLVLLLVNEAARCLDEGVVNEPFEVDLGSVLGMGFPPFRGGILREADRRSAAAVARRLEEFASSLGPRFQPATGLARRAAAGQSFYGTGDAEFRRPASR
jgi:3-hydroxyacyl-CoA dehydrogenase/enoyl-CoA hydratase/3-hydroxybutyryl-CoA epimerase